MIRSYRPSDASILPLIYQRAVTHIGQRFYNPDQIRVWAALTPSPARFEALMADRRVRLIATDNSDMAVAFADMKPDGHIHFLYCAPEAAGRGLTVQLYAALEAQAKTLRLERIYAEASEAAVRFFERQGFRVLERRYFTVDGVPIHNYAVEKQLNP